MMMDRSRKSRKMVVVDGRAVGDEIRNNKVVIPGIIDGAAKVGEGVASVPRSGSGWALVLVRSWSGGVLMVALVASRASASHSGIKRVEELRIGLAERDEGHEAGVSAQLVSLFICLENCLCVFEVSLRFPGILGGWLSLPHHQILSPVA